ncbi:MAG: amidohydrolase family protein [Eubacteriales bacterium]|nr:amidohydrolase family protein [Eubacteriales bacterium]
MITDFHVHTFPEKIAARALQKLSQSANMKYHLDGTLQALQDSMQSASVDRSVLLPVATSPTQYQTINQTALMINERSAETGILSFGGIHPDNENYREILRDLAANGIRGIKLHPVFQGVYLDDIRNLRIIACACEYGMTITVHAGYDISFPGQDYATPAHILSMIEQLHPDKLILAHMGAWGCWDDVERDLAGIDAWFDTSFTLTQVEHLDHHAEDQLSPEQFCRIVRKHGADRIVFGSDSPWGAQADAVKTLQKSGLSEEEQNLIFSENARLLLQESK